MEGRLGKETKYSYFNTISTKAVLTIVATRGIHLLLCDHEDDRDGTQQIDDEGCERIDGGHCTVHA